MKTVIFGYFSFWAVNTLKLQKLFKKQPKSSNCLIICYISSKKNPLFDVDLFSWTFGMESAIRKGKYCPATPTTSTAPAVSPSGFPPGFSNGLESSGQRVISSIGKTKKIAFFSAIFSSFLF